MNSFKKEREKSNNMGIKLIKIFFICFLIFLNIIFLKNIFVTYGNYSEKIKILETLEQEVEDLRIENLENLLEKYKVVSLEYMEKEGRDHLGLSKEGEVIVVIPDELFYSKKLEEELNTAKGVVEEVEYMESKEIMSIWFDFLFKNPL